MDSGVEALHVSFWAWHVRHIKCKKQSIMNMFLSRTANNTISGNLNLIYPLSIDVDAFFNYCIVVVNYFALKFSTGTT